MARSAEPAVRYLCLCLLAAATPAVAQLLPTPSLGAPQDEGNLVEVKVGATRTDNVTRSTTGKVDDTVASAGLVANAARDGTRLDFNLAADLEWFEYLEDTYEGELFGVADGSVIAAIVPERLTWSVRESFSNVVADPFATTTPDNVDSFTYFTTGPRLALALGGATRLIADATYSDVATSSNATNAAPDFDSKRKAGSVSLVREVNRGTSASLVVNTQSVEFDDTVFNTDYDRHEAFVSYAREGARGSLSADLGASRIDQGGASSDALLLRLGASRRTSASSTMAISLTRQTADSADAIRHNIDAQRPATSALQISTGDPFVEDGVGLGWDFARARTSLSLGGFVSKERYETNTNLDRTIRGLNARLTRRMRPTLSFELSGNYQHESFDNVTFNDTEYEGTAALGWQVGRQVHTSLRYQYFKRDGGGAADSYTENRVGINFAYRLTGRAR